MKHTPFGLKDNDCTCTYTSTCRVCLGGSPPTGGFNPLDTSVYVIFNDSGCILDTVIATSERAAKRKASSMFNGPVKVCISESATQAAKQEGDL